MASIPWQARLGIVFLCCSIIVYSTKLVLIDNLPGTIEYIFNSFGFLFINVLMVTLVINELLTIRARRSRLEKLNMVISTFFSEVDSDLLSRIIPSDPGREDLHEVFALSTGQTPAIRMMEAAADRHAFTVSPDDLSFPDLSSFLSEKRNFLLRLLENPVMLEHQTFTGMLQAAFHLTDELARRGDLSRLSPADRKHLAGDVSRVYRSLTGEWIRHMGYLHRQYPYLYSLAVRSNPFDPGSRVEIAG